MKRHLLRTFLLFFGLLFAVFAYADNDKTPIQKQIDSFLKVQKKTISAADTSQLYEALRLSIKHDYPYGIMKAHSYLGDYYINYGDYVSALDYLQRAMEQFPRLKDKEIDKNLLTINIGRCYFEAGRFDESKVLYEDFLKEIEIPLASSTMDEEIRKTILHHRNAAWLNLGSTYINLGQEEEGLAMLKSANEATTTDLYDTEDGYIYNKSNSLISLGFAYLMRNDAQSAQPYLEEYHEYIIAQDESYSDQAKSFGNLAYCAYLLEDLNAAYKYYDQSLELSQKHGYPNVTYVTYKDLSDTYLADNKPKLAIEYLNKHYALKDSIQGLVVQEDLNALEVKYETKLKEQEIVRLEQQTQLERQKGLLYAAGLALLGVLSLFAIGYLMLQNKRRKEKAEQAAQMQALKLASAEQELEYKKQDITRMALDISQKHDFAEQLLEKLGTFKTYIRADAQKEWRSFEHSVQEHVQTNTEQQIFQENIEQVNQAFFAKLEANFPTLSASEKDLCSYIRLGLSNKEISVFRSVTPEAVRVGRHRLRKKLSLDSKQDVEVFLQAL